MSIDMAASRFFLFLFFAMDENGAQADTRKDRWGRESKELKKIETLEIARDGRVNYFDSQVSLAVAGSGD